MCGTANPMECGSYRGIKLLEHAMKVVERIFDHRIRQQCLQCFDAVGWAAGRAFGL